MLARPTEPICVVVYPPWSVFDGEIVGGQFHGPPCQLGILCFGLMKVDQGRMICGDNKMGASYIAVELVYGINNGKKLSVCGSQFTFSLAAMS